jgi:hypothetical protein
MVKQRHCIYVRVSNCGTAGAVNAAVKVYWSTFENSEIHLRFIGSTIIPLVEAGNILAVSDPINWSANKMPPKLGRYCLVATVGNAADPAPEIVRFVDLAEFEGFVRDNNNVACRAFEVVS